MQRTEIDGVTTFWDHGQAPLTGSLVFGVGARHETFRTAEVTHLVEHLVMSTLPKSHLDYNAHVDVDTTIFHATGRPEAVVDFLAQVCQALSDLPLDRLEREAGVLEAEEGASAHPALCWALGTRFGPTGPGLLGVSGPGPKQLRADQVRDFAHRHFVRENAVLVLTGPPPEGLSLPLPVGPRPVETPLVPTSLPVPALLRGEVPSPTLSVVLPRAAWSASVLRILADRILDDLRHDRGVAYSVDFTVARLDPDRTAAALYTDGHDDHVDTIASSIWSALRDLATNGPTQAELDHDRAAFAAYLDDPRACGDWLEGNAYRHLVGEAAFASREEAIQSFARVRVEDVRDWARAALASAVMGLPEGSRLELDGLTDRTTWKPPDDLTFAGTVFRRRLVGFAPRDLAVSVNDEGLSQRVEGLTVGGRWDEVVGVAAAPGLRVVLWQNGRSALLMSRHLKDAESLFAAVDARAAEAVFEASEEQILGH